MVEKLLAGDSYLQLEDEGSRKVGPGVCWGTRDTGRCWRNRRFSVSHIYRPVVGGCGGQEGGAWWGLQVEDLVRCGRSRRVIVSHVYSPAAGGRVGQEGETNGYGVFW